LGLDPRRGDIWYIWLDPTEGSEMAKRRRCVVVSHDAFGRDLDLRVIVPITSWQPAFAKQPFLINIKPDALNGLDKESAINSFQMRCVSVNRFDDVNRAGIVSPQIVAKIAKAITVIVAYDYKDVKPEPTA